MRKGSEGVLAKGGEELVVIEILPSDSRENTIAKDNKYISWSIKVADLPKAIEINPQLAWAYSNRGITYENLNQHEKEIEDFTKAIEINPQDADAYVNRGIAYGSLNQSGHAIQDYTKAIEINPQYANAYANRGDAYQMLNQKEKAIESYQLFLNMRILERWKNR